MPRIFISYRRDDSRAISGRIYDRLVEAFGEENIFKDVDRIPPGSTFADVLEAEMAKCNVLLIIIGQQWVSIADKDGRRRLEDPHDFVRIEVEKGLYRPGMLVIPVLVDEAPVPSPIDLPDTLDKLSSLQVVQVRHDPDFHRDMDRLIDFLKVLQQQEVAVQNREKTLARSNQKRILMGVGVVVTLFVVGFLALIAGGIIKIGQQEDLTFDPEGTVSARLVTLTAIAENEGQIALNSTEEEATVVALIATNSAKSLQPLLGPSITPVPPTIDINATAQAVQAEAALSTQNAQTTLAAQATNSALETQNAPTNTPKPSDTPKPSSTPTPTFTFTPTPNLSATANAESTLRVNAQATITAWAVGTSAANTAATQNAQATQAAIVTPVPYEGILFQEDFENGRLPTETFAVSARIITEADNHVLDLMTTSETDWGRATFSTRNYTDYSFTSRVKIITESVDGSDLHLQIRSSYGRGYSGWFDVNCCGGIGKFINGVYSDIDQNNYSLAQNKWYTLEVRAIGSEIQVYVDNQLVSQATDDTLISGFPYFALPIGVEIYVDDIKVINLRQS